MNSLYWLAPSNNPQETTFETVMAQYATNTPPTPAKTIISISSSSGTSENGGDESQVDGRNDLALSSAREPHTIAKPTPLVKSLLENLSGDLTKIISSKDDTIEQLFTECELARRNALEAENCHLQEKAEILQRAGCDIAKGTARILELHLRVKDLEGEKTALASTSQVEIFQLKKDIIDLKAWKSEAESIVETLHKERREAKAEFEEELAAKDHLLEQAKMKAMEDGKGLEARDKSVKELSNEIIQLNGHKTQLASEVKELKTRVEGYKRKWDAFKDSMDEALSTDEHLSKKAAVVEH
ncbi:hypothetical protein ONS95_003437 [Cadophora gregata]|uniref:uncharacterized protein n=1 Tax=Cadophora gregata TaxID=51156 RepID=UPI0026DCF703|nr:uncharacterized protein ONS95_003437 [Cadophora gregata]KAK0108644.1 hypothetical protein ONS95_003437 [Cadophora gregata]KAK0108765.1 hypothetical protein ONS96_002610 [Cadophora gregata f. sp. sojae]